MVSRVQLDPTSSVPLYRQLSEQIASMIRHGSLPHGERIPPTRELASQLGLNRTTVSAAYGLLETQGFIRGHVGRGSFVQYEGPVIAAEAEGTISFASSRPAADCFPLADFQECCRHVIGSPEAAEILQLGSPSGYPPLRRYLLESARAEGCARASDDVVITNGCQQALDLIGRVLARSGTSVVVEDPVYHGIRNVFERSGGRLFGIPMTSDGVDMEQLARVCAAERPKLIVVTPEFQNPTGATLATESRRALVRLAAEFHVTVVENDIYRDLRYEGEALPTLKQLDETGNVILIRSFSKIAFPGLRVGWLTAPAKLAAQLADARQWCDLHTDHLSQAILLRFAESGRLAAHISTVRTAGRERLRAVRQACERYLPEGSEWTTPKGGMNLWVRLPPGLDAADLLPLCEREGVTYLPGRHFAIVQREASALRLSFGGLSPERIEAGLAILGRVFGKELERAGSADRLESAPALV
jgi:DNA-binding transcriptional MocR family regulator